MAISYVGGVQGGRAGATSTTTQSLSGTLTGGSDTSPSAGDLVVVLCAAGADTTAAPSQDISGNNNGAYTGLTAQSQLGTTYDSYHRVSYIIQGGTVDTSITIPSSGSARNAQRWVVHVFRGVDSTTPMDATATYATGTGTGRPNPAAITPVTAGAWICAFYASAAATGAAYTAPTDFATDWLGGTTADTADCMTGGGYYTGWTSGSYDPAAITAGGTTNAADAWTATTIALRPALPAFTQASYRFYADGTESGSTALQNQDTNHTADVSSGDVNLQLRVRLQETAGNPGDSTDDYQLQYELNDSGTYYNIDQVGSTDVLIDSYDESNRNNDFAISAFWNDGNGQTFVSNGSSISTVKFVLSKLGTPTGNAVVKLYATTGTNNSNAAPTGAALGTSNNLDVSTLTTTPTLTTITFPTPVATTNGVVYAIAIEYSSGDSGNYLALGLDNTSPGHTGGNSVTYNSGSWTGSNTTDVPFYVYGRTPAGIHVIGYNSASLTDGGATTNRLGSGTGSFVAGEISEDGLVDDLQITASNYTELLYSLTIDSDAVADNDTLDFRVLRNSSTNGLTYTVTPRITIEKTVGNYSGTPGIATLTLTAYAPTVAATNNQAVTTATPSSLTLTAQTPTAILDNRATPGTASLTLTAFAPTVEFTNNYAITTASPSALTLTAQTPTATATDNKTITLAAPTALTTTLYEPTVTVSSNQTVTLDTASLTTSTFSIGVAVSDNKAVTPGTASLTLTAFTPTVEFTANQAVTTAAPSSLTLTAQTPSVAATDNKAITLASPTSLTLTPQTPTVAVTNNVFATPGTASLTTTNWTPTVEFTANQAVITASPTALTLTPQTPTVSATDNKAITLASPSSLTLTAQTPTVTATDNKAITTASPTALTTTTHAPGVAVSSSSSITPGTASLSLTAYAPTVEATANVSVTLNTASLSLTAQNPIVDATDNKTATPGTALLSLTAYTPTVDYTVSPIEVTPGVASMVMAMFAPSVSITQNQTITPGAGRLYLRTSYPIVNGQIRERDYYIDSNGDIYWVINQALGLVEKI